MVSEQACHVMVVLVPCSPTSLLAGNMGMEGWFGMAMKGENWKGPMLLFWAMLWLLCAGAGASSTLATFAVLSR